MILAAGRSSRLGRPKQLLNLGGQPLLTRVLHNAASSSLDEIVLVLGHEAASIADLVGEWGQRLVINPDYDEGQSTSVRHGLANVDPASEAVLFLLGDQPGVGPEIIDAVIERFRESGGPIVAPSYGGRRGNPILFARSLFPELAALRGDHGARPIVQAHGTQIVTVPFSERALPTDVDTDEDYAALLESWPDWADDGER